MSNEILRESAVIIPILKATTLTSTIAATTNALTVTTTNINDERIVMTATSGLSNPRNIPR